MEKESCDAKHVTGAFATISLSSEVKNESTRLLETAITVILCIAYLLKTSYSSIVRSFFFFFCTTQNLQPVLNGCGTKNITSVVAQAAVVSSSSIREAAACMYIQQLHFILLLLN